MSLEPVYIRGKVLYPCVPKLINENFEYPKNWFEKNKGKPQLTIKIRQNKDFDALRGIVKYGILHAKILLVDASAYLYERALLCKGTLNEMWKSYGVIIGERGAELNPMSLYDVDVVAIESEADVKSCPATADDDMWMTFYLLAVYRLLRTENSIHREHIAGQAHLIIDVYLPQELRTNRPSFNIMKRCFAGWSHDLNYWKIVACYDMFLFYFKGHEWCDLRFGTVESRFRDCAALSGFDHLMEVTGIRERDQMALWIFCETVANDFQRIYANDPESAVETSYLPYLMDMSTISTRSPFSSVANKSLYFFAHATASMLSTTNRSRHAKMLECPGALDVLKNAKILAIACTMSSRFVTSAANQAFLVEAVTEKPTTLDPIMWYSYYKTKNFDFDEEDKKLLAMWKSSMVTPLPGSIGAYVKTYICRF